MNFVNITYFGATFGIIALFLGMYIASGVEFCFIPIALVIGDWYMTRQRNRRLARDIPRVPLVNGRIRRTSNIRWELEQKIHEPAYLFTDIFKEKT